MSAGRELNIPGEIPSAEEFSEHRDKYCAPIWALWSDELEAKHRPAPVEQATNWYMSPDAIAAIKVAVAAKDHQDP